MNKMKVKSSMLKGKSADQKSKLLTFKLYFILFTLTFILFSCGCSKTVTPIFQPGKTITIDISFNNNIDSVSNKYLILFNKNASSQLVFNPDQLVEPGEAPDIVKVDYYGAIYPTWLRYIVLDNGKLFFVSGPFTSEAAPTKEVIAAQMVKENNRLLINLDMSKFGVFASNDRLNFDIVTIDRTTGVKSKIVKDNLTFDNKSISSYSIYTITNTSASGSDEVMTGTVEAGDITNWRILIQ
jgi:hypothetical protein